MVDLGFKTLNQSQLLSDALYFPDDSDSQAWIVYYISRPLVGSPEGLRFLSLPAPDAHPNKNAEMDNKSIAASSQKKSVKSFSDLMDQFPMIARQMQPGLERIFSEFKREVEKPLPPLPPSESVVSRPIRHHRRHSSASLSSIHDVSGTITPVFHSSLELTAQEEDIRHSLEVAITAAIDLFQMVDKQQLSLLGSSTDLTGAAVERMIERYVTEQMHDSMLFPRICALRKEADVDLESRIRQMVDIDISQVGLSIDMSRQGKQELSARLSKGVELFKKIGVSSSPQEMLELLLETQKIITKPGQSPRQSQSLPAGSDPEKGNALMTINADTLVSLLLVVVIRSPVRHLQARLSYMRHFIFIDDVESGEVGYALSTFEAVLSYLSNESGGLRRSSLRNRKLWQATKAGDITEMKAILEPTTPNDSAMPSPILGTHRKLSISDIGRSDFAESKVDNATTSNGTYDMTAANGSINHVFPFERPSTPEESRSRMKKRVFVQSRSTSISSGYSLRSLPLTISSLNEFEGDLSIETLAQTQGPSGESVIMMAVQSQQESALKYLLNLKEYFPSSMVIDDEDNSGTTLFSAALQTGNRAISDMVLDFVLDNADSDDTVREYFARQDSNGRCAAHYLFNYPMLIDRIGDLITWTLKDKNGQTPLFALCRSYDNEEYKLMVDTSLTSAAKAQRDGPLRLEDHVDNRGNTLLHIVNDPTLLNILLKQCDSEVNAFNDKHFTPFMLASKYGRSDMVRALSRDLRVDFYARDLRGLTATELAKDDDVRNRIDDLVLLSNPIHVISVNERITGVVRPIFVEDGSVRFIIKSGVQNANGLITITTCRRLLSDFEDLARWLSIEHPASWIPNPAGFLSPFLIPSKPSRSIARDMQLRLDSFLKVLLSHSTFGTHEMVWEFFLVPEMEASVHAERSKRKAELRMETVRDEFEPIIDVREVESFVTFAKESVRSVHSSTKAVLRRANSIRHAQLDLYDAASLMRTAFALFEPLDLPHAKALTAYAKCLSQPDFSPITEFYYAMHSISTTSAAMLSALSRPSDLISRIGTARKAVDKAATSLKRASDRSNWPRPLGLQLLDDARTRSQKEAAVKMDKALEEQLALGRELRYTQQVVAGELAGWQDQRAKMGKQACLALATRMVVAEKERLAGMKRMGRIVGLDFDKGAERVAGSNSKLEERLMNRPSPWGSSSKKSVNGNGAL